VNNQAASRAGIALLLAMILFTLLASGTIGAPEQKGSNSKTLDSEFLGAINKGDVHKIKDLAAQGAQVDPPGPAALDLDGLQVVEGTFRYGIRPIACLAAPAPMRRAIETARPDTVEALLQLGADAKREFCEDADTAYFFSMRALYGALANGNSYSARGGGGFIYISGGFIYSSIRPIPAHPATYLSMATELSLGTASGKRRKEYQQIADLLRRAGSPEHAASERATATVAEQASAADVPAGEQKVYQAWMAWSQEQHFNGAKAIEDFAKPALLNRLDWYSAHDWQVAYPGDPTIYGPNQVPYRWLPAEDLDGDG